MGQRSGSMGGNKPGSPPNPNYGTASGVDNSNGVYNAGVATAATGAQSGVAGATGTTDPLASPALPAPQGATGTTTATATLAPQGGYSPITPGNTKGQSGNKAGQPPGMGYPTANNSMTTEAALAANQRPAEYSDYDGKDHTADKAAWDAWNAKQQAAANPTPAAPAGLPPGMQALAQSKAQSKGGTPPSAQGGMIGGMANASNPANAATAGQLPTNTGNAMQDFQNRQKNAQTTLSQTPWMQKMLTGVDSSGGTNQSRAAAEQAGNPIKGGTNTNWQAWVQKQTGQTDAFAAMKQLADTARNTKGGVGQLENMRRAMMADGIDPNTAGRVLELFHNSGGSQEQAARRLGVYDQYAKTFKGDKADSAIANEKELAAWHKANPTGTAPPPTGAAPPTAPPPTAPPPGATGTTDLTGGRNVTTPEKAAVEANAMPPGMDAGKLQKMAQQYGVTPEIALQIYRQMLAQSQSSGGGNSENPGSSGDGGDGV